MQNDRVYGYVFNDFWEDIGTIKSFFEVNLQMAKPDPPFTFYYPEAPIYTSMRFLPSTRMESLSCEDTLVAEGCRIGQANLKGCLIGLRSIIGRGVRMRRTVMMGADYYESGQPVAGFEPIPSNAPPIGVGDECVIEGAIIDKNARIGRDCQISQSRGKDPLRRPARTLTIFAKASSSFPSTQSWSLERESKNR